VSTIWTPGGERPVGEEPAEPTDAELEAQVEQLRQELANTPASVVVANHCFGLFQLAALHLSLQPPKLAEAQLAIDALGALIEGLAGRLGAEEQQLREGLAQLRVAFVQIKAAIDQGSGDAAAASAAAAPEAPAGD
jgi:Domain of unknown function (DUF1844)